MKKTSTRTIALSGLMVAMIAIATAFIKVPVPIGYFHLGDGLIFLAASVLGPWAVLAAAIGSALADAITGYIIYAPATFVIKGAMAYIAWLALKTKPISNVKIFLALILAELVMVFGYFLYEMMLYGFVTASGVIIFNLLQGIFGVIIGFILIKYISKIFNNYK